MVSGDLVADAEGPAEELELGAAFLLHRLHDTGVHLLEDARRAGHEGRSDRREVLDDLVHPPIDGGGEANLELDGLEHLAERVRQRQPEELQVVDGEDLDRLGAGADVGPASVRQFHALGATGGARGVHQGGEVLRPHACDGLVDRAGVLGEMSSAERLEVGQAEDPLPVGVPVEGDHSDDVGEVVTKCAELGDLGVVLGEDEACAAVGEDVSDVLDAGRRVDRRRRCAGAHDREVGIQPLDAGRGSDRDPLLRPDAQCEQPRGHGSDRLRGLPPRHGLPPAGHGMPECLARGSGRDAVEEQSTH